MKSSITRFFFFNLLLIVSSSVYARELKVCSSGCAFSSIQEAVNAALKGDTILVNIEGAFTENNITISKDLVIRGLGQEVTVLQAHAERGQAMHRLFYITGGAKVILEYLTIQHGVEKADPTQARGNGGGILVEGSNTSLTLNYVSLKHCDAQIPGASGGAIALMGTSTSLTINNSLLDNNIANNGSGGGIYLASYGGDFFTRNTGFDNNIAANGNGGAVYMEGSGSSTFISSSFTGNQSLNSHNGGAVFNSGSVPTFNNCLFLRNSADKDGGALKIDGADIANCTFYFNTALNGGAISQDAEKENKELYLSNCTLLNNAATGFGSSGAGLHTSSASAQVYMINTVIDKSTSGSDLYLFAASSLATNEKNKVGKASFTNGSVRFATN
jgi:sulfur transfer complex TusBCD TusB component (DsrH family)